MIIDIHNHPNWHGHNIDKLIENMDQHGIDKCWLLSWEISKQDFDLNPWWNRYMDPRGICAPLWMVVEGLQRYPQRFIGGYAPDPRDRYARSKLIAAVEIHGIKVYGELKLRMRYDDPDAIAMFRFCAKLGLPVLFHMECDHRIPKMLDSDVAAWPEWYGGDFAVIENMCRLCPETSFIGHAMGFWREIADDADVAPELNPGGPVHGEGRLQNLLRRHQNLYCDLSGTSGSRALGRDLKNAEKFVVEFQDRIMFGRDYFDRAQMDVLEKLNLPRTVLDKILFSNSQKLIK